MKAILEITDTNIKHEFDNLKIEQFEKIYSTPCITLPPYAEEKPAVLITSNMPESLRKCISDIIRLYYTR